MFYVYILFSEVDKKLYVGCTSDLGKRLEKHVKGYVRATKHRRPVVLIHSEQFNDKGNAFQRERFLKSLWGAREKNKIRKQYLERRV